MKQETFLRWSKQLASASATRVEDIGYKVFKPKSVYFYTLHKCASTLFSSFILKSAKGLNHVDYCLDIYQGADPATATIIFKDRGEIYGPLRLSTRSKYPDYHPVILPASQPEFINGKRAIFFIRDPRDILVSSYYSYSKSHNFSIDHKYREIQEENRRKLQNQPIDEFVLEQSELHLQDFIRIKRLAAASGDCVLLKYEDMINQFTIFADGLSKFLHPRFRSTYDEIYRRTRPRSVENVNSHRRSGKTGGFRTHLRQDTIDKLNHVFAEIFDTFNYTP